MEKVTDPDIWYLEISGRLGGNEQALHQMSRGLSGVRKSSDTALGRNHNNFFYGIPEPLVKAGSEGGITVR